MNQEQEEKYCDALEGLIDYAPVDVFVRALSIDLTIFDSHLFYYACRCGNLPVAQWLYTNRDVKINGYASDVDRPRLLNKIVGVRVSCEKNPLWSAFHSYRFDVVRWLLSLPNIEGSVSWVCLLYSAIVSLSMYRSDWIFPMDIIDALIQKCTGDMLLNDINPVLHCAVEAPEEHRLPLVLKLLAAGADLHYYSPDTNDFALNRSEPGSKVEHILQNWRTVMLLHCFKECGVAVDCHSLMMLGELAFDNTRDPYGEDA